MSRIFLLFLTCLVGISNLSSAEHDVVVVGAGFAGIVAAHKLKKAGFDVVILEARDRIGGRVWSVDKWGRSLELGGAWIHKIFNNPVYDLAQYHDIKTTSTTFSAGTFQKLKSYALYDKRGKKISQEDLDKTLTQIDDLKGFALIYFADRSGNVPLDELVDAYIKSKNLSQRESDLLVFLLNHSPELYSGVKDISIKTLVTLQSQLSGSDVIVPEGYASLLSKLVKELCVELNTPVTKIQDDGNKVTVFTKDGREFRAKYVVVTVPLGVLKSGNIEFLPPLPQEKKEAIDRIGVAVVDKIFLHFEKPFWDINSEWILAMAPTGVHQYEFFNFYQYSGGPILIAFTASDFACDVEQMSNEAVVEDVMANLRVAYGNKIPNPTDTIVTRWGLDPYSLGSYSYPRIGSSIKDFEILGQSINNRIFFAGEATSTTHPSTVTGAFMTGADVAETITSLGK